MIKPGLRVVFGIIPACAGSTAYLCKKLSRSRDHPRMRGEHNLAPMI